MRSRTAIILEAKGQLLSGEVIRLEEDQLTLELAGGRAQNLQVLKGRRNRISGSPHVLFLPLFFPLVES